MAHNFEYQKKFLLQHPSTWLITGCAGFIGSNLLEQLLLLNQSVVGLDNFSTGYQRNLDEVRNVVTKEQWQRFRFINGDICDFTTCESAVSGVDFVLHQAALGSVPRSIYNPIATNETNISGFLNVLQAARLAQVKGFVYAASSSTYGDHPALPKIESNIGNPLSPYAVTKYVNELYADVFSRCYGLHVVGLRYFNVFGPRQDPNGAYAAVIPKWIASMIKNESIVINGDGETSRDFCFVANVVQANILAALSKFDKSEVFNIAVGDRTTLNELFNNIRNRLGSAGIKYERLPVYKEFRPGDVRHSQANIQKAQKYLGYSPNFKVEQGLELAMPWYLNFNG